MVPPTGPGTLGKLLLPVPQFPLSRKWDNHIPHLLGLLRSWGLGDLTCSGCSVNLSIIVTYTDFLSRLISLQVPYVSASLLAISEPCQATSYFLMFV